MEVFMTHKRRDRELDEMAWATVQARQDWDDKFTADEMDFIDNVVGRESFDKLVGVFVRGNESHPECKLAASFACLESLKKMIATLSSSMGGREGHRVMKDVLGESIHQTVQQLPSVPPNIGFPSNQDVMDRHDQWIKSLKQCPPGTVGFSFASTPKSPFGPVSSSACFEELSELQAVHLNQLRTSVAGVVPHSKILLTVKHTTFVSPSKTVTTVVEDEAGQCISMQIHNMPNVQTNSFGMNSMPIGARFYLRNPFLKVAPDGWLTLRVDQPFDLEPLDVPPLHGSILIIGDGDFSFSAALAQKNRKHGNSFIVASSLDSHKTIVKRYKKGKRNLDALELDPKVKVFHGLDATDLTPLGDIEWDSIVWNFPYPSEGTGRIPATICRELLSRFLDEMDKHLKPDGRLYLTLAPRQGGTTREAAGNTLQWDVETVASEARMEVVDVVPFHHDEFAGYEPRRAYADASFPCEGAKTHILGLKKEAKIGETPSERTIFSRISSMLIDRKWGPSSATIVKHDIVKQLEPYANTSQTARSLLDAAKSFEAAIQMIDALIAQKTIDFEASVESLALLARVFRTPYGELVVQLDAKQLNVLLCNCRRVIASLFGLEENVQNDGDSLKLIRAVQQLNIETGDKRNAIRDQIEVEDLFLILLVGEAMFDKKKSIASSSIIASMMPESMHVLYFHASNKANVLADKHPNAIEQANPAELVDIVKDGERALEILKKSDPLYSSFIYLMAGMYLYLACSQGESSSARSTHVWLSISLFEEYIGLVESVDRSLAPAHYRLGLAYILAESFETKNTSVPKSILKASRYHYTRGLEAEKKRLPFFGPLSCQFKRLLSIAVMAKPGDNQKSQGNTGSRSNKSPMKDEEELSKEASSLLDEERVFFENIKQMMKRYPNGFDLSYFRDAYSQEFEGRRLPLQKNEQLKQLINRAEEAGACQLEKGNDSEFRVCAPVDDNERTFFANIEQLMKKSRNGVYLGRFRKVYSQEFEGRSIPIRNNESLKQIVARAEKAGACRLEKRGSTEYWVSPTTKR